MLTLRSELSLRAEYEMGLSITVTLLAYLFVLG
jgi:hypothetical protein